MRWLVVAVTVISLLQLSSAQDGVRGRRRKVLRRRPSGQRSFQNQDLVLESIPAVPTQQQRVAPPPQPAPAPVQTTGEVITDVACPEPEGLQVYPHPDSCNHFYKCANGTLTLETCGNGLLFNEATAISGAADNHCSYIWQSECGNRPNDTTPISTPGCEYQFGIFPSGDGCFASYTKCGNGVPREVYCQLGLAYDHRIHTCNWPDLLVESAGCDPSAALGDFRCPSDAELSPLAKRFFPFPRFPVPKDPQLYIICVNGMPRLNSCGEGSLFSEASLGCEEQL